jgi:D-alanyl-D-alanine carboxypeptidase
MFILLLFSSFMALASELSERIDQIRLKHQVPALTAVYFKDGQKVEHVISGVRKNGDPTLIKPSDKFPLGSCGKAMTATIAATFIEEGKLNWTDTLSKLLPDLEMHPDFQEVTFEMLLSHRSGLITDQKWEDYLKWKELEISRARYTMVSNLLKEAPDVTPGTFKYSNAGYITVGYILEQISGKSWEMLIQERLFSKLGMNSCGFGPTTDGTDTSPVEPWGHLFKDNQFIPSQTDNAPYYGPAGGIHCTITDWAKFINMHLLGFNQEGNFLKSKTFKKLHQVFPEKNSQYTYGAWGRVNRSWANGPVLSHNGTNVRNYVTVLIVPAKKSFMMSTTNVGSNIGKDATNDVIKELIQTFYK